MDIQPPQIPVIALNAPLENIGLVQATIQHAIPLTNIPAQVPVIPAAAETPVAENINPVFVILITVGTAVAASTTTLPTVLTEEIMTIADQALQQPQYHVLVRKSQKDYIN